jgi:TRAP-type C4-dicarboxylate transport system substrate-binding protein
LTIDQPASGAPAGGFLNRKNYMENNFSVTPYIITRVFDTSVFDNLSKEELQVIEKLLDEVGNRIRNDLERTLHLCYMGEFASAVPKYKPCNIIDTSCF